MSTGEGAGRGSKYELDWSAAQVSNRQLAVPWEGATPPTAWLDSFVEVLSVWESETRGQQWDAISVGGEHVVISELDPPGLESLKQYLADASRSADDRHVKQWAADTAARHREEAAAEARAEKDAELRRLLDENK